ncbi:MAG: hypothetical protein K6T81_02955 [Alicyclobacillus macrosporangiidus]|uniref:xylulokinase n=1 Tax=Alicyclobacillus macrosporangiidus TaxID=392015 RepID=UPI0026EB374F|nr:FGGY family carbohydrate kinase [Alicyclobacillus macrosporangiidus]MCL6597681.1 hypothetical protein [Alicyclobacillus macrosporangiidus]
MTAREAILALDLGTTVCKAVLFSQAGEVLASAERRLEMRRTGDGGAEQDPETWWSAATAAVRAAVASVPQVSLAAVTLCAQRETLVPIDERMRPLHDAMLWLDARGADLAVRWRERYGPALQDWTGLVPAAPYSAGKIHWWKQHRPDVASRTRWYLQPKDYLVYRLTGRVATDVTLAARTLLYNPRLRAWQPELLADLGIEEHQLPPVLTPDEWVGEVTREAAEAWGIPSGTPVLLGGGDRSCEVYGCGLAPGEVMESSGTTSNVAAVTGDPRPGHPAVSATPHVVRGQWVWELGLAGTGAGLEWLRAWVVQAPHGWADLDRRVSASRPGAGGLLALPFFLGARAPRWSPEARGALVGLRGTQAGPDVVRAVAEGLAYELNAALVALREAGIRVEAVRVTGGLARSGAWNRIKASVYRCPVRQGEVAYGAAFGAFLLAAHRLGWPVDDKTARRWNPVVREYLPDPAWVRVYQTGYPLYEEVYRRLSPVFSSLEAYRRLSEEAAPQNPTDALIPDDGLC